MKQKIAILRLVGVIALVAFMVSLFITTPASAEGFGKFSQLQQLLMLISFACFGIVMAMQVYRLYIQYYLRREENGDDEQE